MEYFIRSRYLGTNFGEANRALLEAKLVEHAHYHDGFHFLSAGEHVWVIIVFKEQTKKDKFKMECWRDIIKPGMPTGMAPWKKTGFKLKSLPEDNEYRQQLAQIKAENPNIFNYDE